MDAFIFMVLSDFVKGASSSRVVKIDQKDKFLKLLGCHLFAHIRVFPGAPWDDGTHTGPHFRSSGL